MPFVSERVSGEGPLNDIVRPGAIDGDFVPRGIAGTVVVHVGGEAVLVGGPLHATVLNATGVLLWESFDGQASLDTIAHELSDALGADEEQVRDDVVTFARGLGAAGLLDGVGDPPPEIELIDEPETAAPTAITHDALATVAGTDLAGNRHTLAEHHGREVLLVNWSPTCGFCTMIAGALAAWRAALEHRGVDLVFLTQGDPEPNRAVFAAAGLDAPAFVRTEGADPFFGAGTPAALHLDAVGALVGPVALGAFEVPMRAATLAGIEPDEAAAALAPDRARSDEPLDRIPEGTRYLPVAGGMCGAGATTGGGAPAEWLGTRVYRLAGYHVGVRYDATATAEVLDRLLPGARVQDPRAPRTATRSHCTTTTSRIGEHDPSPCSCVEASPSSAADRRRVSSVRCCGVSPPTCSTSRLRTAAFA